MNVLTTNRNASSSRDYRVVTPARSERRERDFGTGYGRSSGYAAARDYAGTNHLRMFRFA